LVEVDPGGAEAGEAVLDSADNVAAGCTGAMARVVHRHAELGGEHDILPAGAEDLAEQFLRRAAVAGAECAVDIRRVEQGDAGVKGGVDNRAGGLESDTATKIIAAEADRGNAQTGAAQKTLFDGGGPLAVGVG
jgi:hypothetical protein